MRVYFLPRPAALLCVLLLSASGFTAPALAQPTDADFIVARDAFRAGDAARLERVAPRLKGHLLEQYITYWQLRLKLDDADPERVRAFLARYEGTPLSDKLRGEWLKSLARREQWALFAAEYPKRAGDDTDLDCYAIQWKRARDGDAALGDARRYWASGQDQPESCQTLFAALLKSGQLTPAELWARFRMAHEAGNARLVARIAADLPVADRPTSRDLERAERSAQQVLSKNEFRPTSVMGRELTLYALDRAARADPGAARESWAKLRDRFPVDDRRYGNLLVAHQGAKQLNPAANAWYREVEGVPMSTEQHAWQVRAALRARAWPEVYRAIDAMTPDQALEPTWRYWKARAFAEAGHTDDATRLYAGLATEQHFYGLLAAEALGAAIMPISEPLTPNPALVAAFSAREDVKRVAKLTALDLRPDAIREWAYIVRGQGDDGLLLAAEVARRYGLYDRSINSADRTVRRHDFALRYQTPYRTEISDASREANLDPALVFGLARQESRFIADISSSAGAIGLMQLMPPTAKWVARQTGRADFAPRQLDNPALNAQLGTYYLRHVLDRLDGLPVLATAAYNAGPGRAQLWRGPVPLEGAIYAETIPFNETRDYVKKVLANAMYYQAQLGLPYVALKERLGVVSPAGAGRGVAGIPAADTPEDAR